MPKFASLFRSEYRTGVAALCLIVAAACLAPKAMAQTGDVEEEAVTVEQIDQAVQRVEESGSLDEAAKTRVLEVLNNAREQVRSRKEWESKTQELESARLAAPDRIQEIEAELLMPARSPDIDQYRESSSIELRELLAAEERELIRLRDDLSKLEQEPARRAELRRNIPELQTKARERLEEVSVAVETGPNGGGESSMLLEARRLAARARKQAIEAELAGYEAQLRSYDARSRLLTLRTDQTRRALGEAEQRTAALRDLLAETQAREARQATARARARILEASNAPREVRDIVQELADENADLIQKRTGSDGVAARIRESSQLLDRFVAQIAELEQEFDVLQAKVTASGRGEALGLLMQNQLADLPDIGELGRGIQRREEEIGDIQLTLIELNQRRRELGNVEDLVREATSRFASSVPDAEREVMADVVRQAYGANRKAIDALITDYEAAFDRLVDINASAGQVIELTKEMRRFIFERILWIRSGTPINSDTLRDTVTAVEEFTSTESLRRIPAGLWLDIRSVPIMYGVFLILATVLIGGNRRFRKQIRSISADAGRSTSTDQLAIFRAGMYSILYGLAFPVPAVFLGWRIQESYEVDSAGAAIGSGILWAGIIAIGIQVVRAFLINTGVCDTHLRWNRDAVASLRRFLLFGSYGWIPAAAVVMTCESYGNIAYKESLGRLAFLALLATALPVAAVLLRPRTGPVSCIARAYRERNLYQRLEKLVFVVALAGIVGIGVAAGIGYYYSALQLFTSLTQSIALLFFCWLALGVALRWSLIEKRKLILEQWRKLRETDESVFGEPSVDVDRVDTQITNILRFIFLAVVFGAMAFVWTAIVPALGVLDGVSLWTTTETVTTETTDAEGASTIETYETAKEITLRHLLIVFLIALVTVVCVRNLPGILEVAVLKRLSLNAGERYAVSSIMGYCVGVVGLVVGLGAMGLNWSQLQWLVAALGLGLGFGLQEIFANFVSGLIILFERPIRVGDIVTVGDISGRVSRINIRATWITGFNRRDLVVPNKEFVTAQLVNWSLSDQTLRIEVPVGIAYGSDVRLAKRLLLQAAKESELVMTDPKPEAYFLGFGDNALSLELRVFSPNIESYLAIEDAVHQHIDDLFRENDIEISFPQRDLHVRTIPEEWRGAVKAPSEQRDTATEEEG